MLRSEEPLSDNILSKKESEDKEIDLRLTFPAPSILKTYNEAFENGAYQVFLEIQKILDHKIAMDKLSTPIKLKQRRSGQIYGFVIALSFLIASFILIILGFGIYGTILGSVNLIGLVSIFVLKKSQTNGDQ